MAIDITDTQVKFLPVQCLHIFCTWGQTDVLGSFARIYTCVCVCVCVYSLQFCMYIYIFWPQGMWNLSSPIRNWTHTLCIGRQSLNHWINREVPYIIYMYNWVSVKQKALFTRFFMVCRTSFSAPGPAKIFDGLCYFFWCSFIQHLFLFIDLNFTNGMNSLLRFSFIPVCLFQMEKPRGFPRGSTTGPPCVRRSQCGPWRMHWPKHFQCFYDLKGVNW